MAWSFGNIFRDAAQTFPGAFARSQEIEAQRPQRELAELQVEQLRQELENNANLEKDIQEFIQKGAGKQITGKGQAVQAWRKFYPIAALPPGKARKIPVQAFARQSEAKARVVPSKSFTDFLMGADQETLKTFFEETENELLSMPDSDPKKLMSVISDDAASAEAITKTQVKVEAQRAAVEKKAGEAGNGGELTPVESLEAKDRARLQKVNARWRASKQAYDGIQTFAAQLSAKGYDPAMINARIGPQLEKSKAEFERYDKMREDLRGNKRENLKARADEFRDIQGEQRQESMNIRSENRAEDRAVVGEIRRDVIADENAQAERNPVQVLMPTGEQVTVLTDGRGGFYDPSGAAVQLPPNARVVTATMQGGAQDIGLTKPTQTAIEEGVIKADDTLARLDEMERLFDPSFLTVGGQMGAKSVEQLQRFGFNLKPEWDAYGADFAQFSSEVMGNLNVTIKDLTGAAMTAAEVPRIEASIATMNRSPETFQAVLKQVRRRTEAARARLVRFKQVGMSEAEIKDAMSGGGSSPGGISLDRAEKFVALKEELTPQLISGKIDRAEYNKQLNAAWGK